MPSLALFGKRTPIADDDVRVYAIVTLLMRLVQLGCAIAVIIHLYYEHEPLVQTADEVVEDLCLLEENERDQLWAFTTAFIAFSVVLAAEGIVYAASIWVVSERGTPTDQRARARPLEKLCHFNLTAAVVVRITTVALGINLHRQLDTVCLCFSANTNVQDRCDAVFYTLFCLLFYPEAVELCLNAGTIFYACSSRILPAVLPRGMDSESRWRLFCRCCCTLSSVLTCCLMGGREALLGDYTDIAMLLSDFFDFHGTLDVTHSDMVVGLLLVREVQQQRINEVRKMIVEKSKEPELSDGLSDHEEDKEVERSLLQVIRKFQGTKTLSGIAYRLKRYEGGEHKWEPAVSALLSKGNESDRLIIAEGARFMRLSLAIYTWIMYSINRPCTGFCSIFCEATVRSCKTKQARFAGDGCCRLHSAALLKQAGIMDEADIVYAYFLSDVVASPYAVVLDHDWKSVVIVIRGTQSLEDVLTDLEIEPICLELVGIECGFDGVGKYAHAGMLQTCQWILKDMRKRGTIEKLLEAKSKFSNYRLRITGHSLGAGCAAILAMMLKPKYPNLRCHSFSPPGCTMSENAAKECEDYLTSYVLDADIVPRASLNALDNLRQDAVEMIARIKVPKTQVFDEYTFGCIKGDATTSRVDRLLYQEDEIPESPFVQEWRKYRQIYEERKVSRGRSTEVELFVPGKIVHLFPTITTTTATSTTEAVPPSSGRPLGCCLDGVCNKPPKQKQYEARWANRLDFREIQIASHFVDDHLPLAVLKGLEAEAERFGLELPFVTNESKMEQEAS